MPVVYPALRGDGGRLGLGLAGLGWPWEGISRSGLSAWLKALRPRGGAPAPHEMTACSSRFPSTGSGRLSIPRVDFVSRVSWGSLEAAWVGRGWNVYCIFANGSGAGE